MLIFCQKKKKKNTISKVKRALVLKGILPETTYVCFLTPPPPLPPIPAIQNEPLKSPPILGLRLVLYKKIVYKSECLFLLS